MPGRRTPTSATFDAELTGDFTTELGARRWGLFTKRSAGDDRWRAGAEKMSHV